MASIETRLKALEEKFRERAAIEAAEQQKRQNWRLAFSFLPRTSKFELYLNVVLYLNDELQSKTDQAERRAMVFDMWWWVVKIVPQWIRASRGQNEEVADTIQELKDDGRWGEFWQVFKRHLPKWNALFNWLQDLRTQKFDGQNVEQEAWRRDLE